jgi:23S rRNA (guanosine2251-2'-O)-methyltransferase
MKYSEKKFKNFSEEKQQKILLEFIRVADIGNINEFIDCLKFSGKSKYETIIEKLQSVTNVRSFLEVVVPLERELKADLRDQDFLIFSQDKLTKNNKTIPLTLILDSLRSSFNIGSIFRTAECFSINELILCGYTATPENEKVQKTSMGTSDFVKWQSIKQTEEAITELKKQGVKIYALETTSNATSIHKTKFEEPCALVLGNEALGISKEILRLVDEIISVPLSGRKNSLNVGVTAAICCYEVSKQWSKK